jgi:tRNA(Arg) A34 adenosine deaminase TadA
MTKHRDYLLIALEEARLGQTQGQIPIGCTIVAEDGSLLARAHNRVVELEDPTAHAEMLAIRAALDTSTARNPRDWALYSTLEPCAMCLGTIVMCHIGTVVWAAPDPYIEGHKLLSATAHMRSRRLQVIACSCPEIERESWELHKDYWIAKGRPEAVQPIEETVARDVHR